MKREIITTDSYGRITIPSDTGNIWMNEMELVELFGAIVRYSEEFAQLVVVDVVASFLGLVEHIESAHHADVHIDELSGEIEVALQVAGVDDVDDDIGSVLDELLAYIEFLGRVG